MSILITEIHSQVKAKNWLNYNSPTQEFETGANSCPDFCKGLIRHVLWMKKLLGFALAAMIQWSLNYLVVSQVAGWFQNEFQPWLLAPREWKGIRPSMLHCLYFKNKCKDLTFYGREWIQGICLHPDSPVALLCFLQRNLPALPSSCWKVEMESSMLC